MAGVRPPKDQSGIAMGNPWDSGVMWTYCERWNKLTETPVNPMTPAQARARHASGELYAAIASPDSHSVPTLRVQMRDSLDYTFTLLDESLFLESATSYDYGESKERGGYADAERMETYEFTTDGFIHRAVDVDGQESRESRQGVDVTGSWEQVPNFGAYDALTRRDHA
ncbi:hypothetical protein [Streptomyces spinosirectus]